MTDVVKLLVGASRGFRRDRALHLRRSILRGRKRHWASSPPSSLLEPNRSCIHFGPKSCANLLGQLTSQCETRVAKS